MLSRVQDELGVSFDALVELLVGLRRLLQGISFETTKLGFARPEIIRSRSWRL